jgi:DNA-binding CsgD family transcriptional regulator
MITTVAVVARFRVYQEILADVIGSCPELAVIGVAGVATATQIIRLLVPDVIVIDADVPELVTILFAARSASVRTVVMGVAAPGNVECDVLLPENARTSDLLDSLRSDRTALDVLGVHRSSPALTRRESQVMRLVGQGYSNKEIATELSVSLATVKSHVHSVLRKVGQHRRGDAARVISGRTTGEDLSGVAPARLYIQPAAAADSTPV